MPKTFDARNCQMEQWMLRNVGRELITSIVMHPIQRSMLLERREICQQSRGAKLVKNIETYYSIPVVIDEALHPATIRLCYDSGELNIINLKLPEEVSEAQLMYKEWRKQHAS